MTTPDPVPQTLTELQHFMEKLLIRPRALDQDPELLPVLRQLFAGGPALSPEAQLEIYREQFWLRHTANLLEDFPGVAFLLGEERWQELSSSYLTRAESLPFALRDLGAGLPGHLAERVEEGFLDGSLGPLALDMARLEWAYVDVFDAPDEPDLDADRVARIAPEHWGLARFGISRALCLLVLQHPVADLRRAIKRGEADPRQLPASAPSHLVVYRRERNLWDKQLSEPAYRLLEQLAEGQALVPSCETVVREYPEAQQRLEEELFTWFSLWGRLGWIREVQPGPATE